MLKRLPSRFKLSDKPKEWAPSLAAEVPEIVVAVMGMTGAGKSSLIKHVTGHEAIVVGHGLRSTTSEVNSYRCHINGTNFVLVDTPGFNDTYRDEKEILQEITTWLSKTYASGKQLNGIIYLHPIVNTRMEGSSLLSLQIFRKLCGPQCYGHIFLCTTFWDVVDESVGDRREKELCQSTDLWALMKQKGSKVVRIRDYDQSKDILLEIAQKSSIVLDIQREVVDKSMPIESTSAGQLVDQQSSELKKALSERKRKAEEAAARKLRTQNETHEREMREEQARVEKLRQAQAALFEEQKKQNEELQRQLLEAAEMKVRTERERKLRLDREAQQQRRAQEQQRQKLEQEEKKREAERVRQATARQEQWERQDRAKRLATTWQVQLGLLERAHSLGLIQAKMYRLNNQAPVFMLACDFCHRLIGFQGYYNCQACDYAVCDACITKKGPSVGFYPLHRVTYHPNPPPLRYCRRLKPHLEENQHGGVSCSRCMKLCSGMCFHCCDCDNENFDLCLECITTKGATCYRPYQHILHPMFASLAAA